uniref:ParE toxin of type II toxin-antitoxin system, parDE n=1 Tax=Candidatus Kentrum sp. MB TaxID=2138164 RepID=A0A450X517_9GAMM|nr:MAG: ParE toxin of type II toxin-antitoxin system, parDE [Candidatus Kentron sp. MB]VFK34316.1 MAG: ParE toxin of type II toxin-antitoxin system, parDE [Candidatus Kentron sp. MB]VFK76653.1 MAG: ParE toxin of type II toxin-antitoxin system, parDE [Candidatus Kentron sp. MB]
MKKYKVNFSDAAKNDLHELYDYIAGASLDKKFSASFIQGLNDYIKEALSYFPDRFPVYKGNVRKAVYTRNTNYIILFEIHKAIFEVFVLVVTNAKQYTRYYDLG